MVLSGLIGDLASHFGCTVGLKDSVTSISMVALGTSLPGTVSVAKKLQFQKINFTVMFYVWSFWGHIH